MVTKDKNDFDIGLYLSNLNYSQQWGNYSSCEEVKKVLSHASKKNTNERGIPDYIYVNNKDKFIILVEIKPTLKEHKSYDGISEPEKFAVDGIKHYLKFFKQENLTDEYLKSFFSVWKIVGLAISGDLTDEYLHEVSTFLVQKDTIIEQISIKEILNEADYLNLFCNVDEEEIIQKISSTSKKVNKLLRVVESQERPVLISALMICLFDMKNKTNDFKNGYKSWNAETIISNIPQTVKIVLKEEKIPEEKVNVLLNKLSFLKDNPDLKKDSTNILKQILKELNFNVLPLFKHKSNYDIIGKFYEEFLRYAGLANVKKGIVLTPHHITTLFTDLVPMKSNDVILDTCCGTGAFLIAAMNKLIDIISKSNVSNKTEQIKNIKTKQLIGFESNPTMYSLAVSNMLFRGDGKSQIFPLDSFDPEADETLEKLKGQGITPTIGFINPPYGGKDNKENPTKKEIQFLIKLLDVCSRYVVMIAPLSTYFLEDKIRENILKNHTLKYVINMPKDLFMPNAATNTAISVFETHRPHEKSEVIFVDLKDDGFVMSKNKGRTDACNKWSYKKTNLLEHLKYPEKYKDNITLVKTKITGKEEWLLQAHSETDYSSLSNTDFLNSIKGYLSYKVNRDRDIFDKNINTITMFEILQDYYDTSFNEKLPFEKISTEKWQNFLLTNIFDEFSNGKCSIAGNLLDGNDIFYLGAKKKDCCIIKRVAYYEDLVIRGNCIAFICDGDGSVGYSNYIDLETFIGTTNLAFGYNKNLTKYNALFLVAILDKERSKYSFGRKYKTRIPMTKIKLPALKDVNKNFIKDEHGNYLPDWQFMEDYIKSLPYSNNL